MVFTGLSGWLNGIRNMEIFQPSVHDQRKGTRACSPLTGSSGVDKQAPVGPLLFLPAALVVRQGPRCLIPFTGQVGNNPRTQIRNSEAARYITEP